VTPTVKTKAKQFIKHPATRAVARCALMCAVGALERTAEDADDSRRGKRWLSAKRFIKSSSND
jgi:hypothetical protein